VGKRSGRNGSAGRRRQLHLKLDFLAQGFRSIEDFDADQAAAAVEVGMHPGRHGFGARRLLAPVE